MFDTMTQCQYFKFIVSVNFIDGDIRCTKRKLRHLTPPYLLLVPSNNLHFHRRGPPLYLIQALQ